MDVRKHPGIGYETDADPGGRDKMSAEFWVAVATAFGLVLVIEGTD